MKIANYLFFNEYSALLAFICISKHWCIKHMRVCSQEQGNDNGECISAKVNLCNDTLMVL
jgi:hypothetical protein